MYIHNEGLLWGWDRNGDDGFRLLWAFSSHPLVHPLELVVSPFHIDYKDRMSDLKIYIDMKE